jgi:hypothetical protein
MPSRTEPAIFVSFFHIVGNKQQTPSVLIRIVPKWPVESTTRPSRQVETVNVKQVDVASPFSGERRVAMKRLGLLLAAVMVFAVAGVALAEEGAKKTDKPAKTEYLQGVLVSITIDATDSTKATLVVNKEKKVTITVDSTTKIRKDEADAKLSDLKVGDMMRITPTSGLAKLVVAKTVKEKKPEAGEKASKAGK